MCKRKMRFFILGISSMLALYCLTSVECKLTLGKKLARGVCAQQRDYAETGQLQPPLKKKEMDKPVKEDKVCLEWTPCKGQNCSKFGNNAKCPTTTLRIGKLKFSTRTLTNLVQQDENGMVVDSQLAGEEALNNAPAVNFIGEIYNEPVDASGVIIRCNAVIYNICWIVTTRNCAQPSLDRKAGKITHKIATFSVRGEYTKLWCDQPEEHVFEVVDAFAPDPDEPTDPYNATKLGASIALLKINPLIDFRNKLLGWVTFPKHDHQCKGDASFLTLKGVANCGAHDEFYEEDGRNVGSFGCGQRNFQMSITYEPSECSLPNGTPIPGTPALVCGRFDQQAGPTCYLDYGAPIFKYSEIDSVSRLRVCGILSEPSCLNKEKPNHVFTFPGSYWQWMQTKAGPQPGQ